MRPWWWGFWKRPGVVDRAAGTNTTPAEWGLGDGVLMERTGDFDRTAGTSTIPAEWGLGGWVLRERPGIISSPPWHLQQGQGPNGYCWTPSDYFIHQESYQSLDPTGYCCFPLPIPSTRNHLFLLYGVFNRARMILGIVGLPMTIPSTKNHLFLLQGTLNRARIMLSIACLPWIFHPPGIISFLSMAPRSCWLLLASLLLFHP